MGKKKFGGWTVDRRYVVAIDFEAVCEEGQDYVNAGQEIIEFPAVAIDTITNEIVAEFHSYVKPVKKPKLTKYCTELTGITQKMVNRSPYFETVLGNFLDWLNRLKSGEFNSGGLRSAASNEVVFATHGTKDFFNFLRTSCRASGVSIPKALKGSFIDIQESAKSIFESNPEILKNCDHTTRSGNRIKASHKVSLENLAAIFNVAFLGRNHSGLADSRVIAEILINWSTSGHMIKPNAILW